MIILPTANNKTEINQIFDYFVQNYRKPFAVQKFGENWKTVRRQICDYDLERHAWQTHAIGLNAANYPNFVNFDIDRPEQQEAGVLQLLDDLGISESQQLVVTTPGFKKRGSYRIYIRPTYNFRPCTFNLLRRFIIDKFSYLCEIYPQPKRIDRIPCSYGSDIIKENCLLSFLTLQGKLDEFANIDPWEIDFAAIAAAAPALDDKIAGKQAKQQLLAISETDEQTEIRTIKSLHSKPEMENLYRNGLQANDTRYDAQFQILMHLWRSGELQPSAEKNVRAWVKTHSNGFSATVTEQRWRIIDGEIHRQASTIWNDYRPTVSDAAQNITAVSTVQDLKLCAELFYGDAVRQKQLFALLAYYRPRAGRNPFVQISNKNWRGHIASYKTYKELQEFLEEKGILEADRRFDVRNFAQKFRLNLNLTGDVIRENSYGISNFYEAHKTVHNNDLRSILRASGIDRTTVWRNF